MKKADQTVHIKLDKNVQVREKSIFLKDIAKIECGDKDLEEKIKELHFLEDLIKNPGRYVFSILNVFETIHRTYPEVVIENLGETDFIITYEKKKQPGQAVCYLKTLAVAFLSFFGAAFAIMTFNNDVDIQTLFGQIYWQFTGSESDGFTILELSYSIGLGLGILIFFNHFAGKKLTQDPTPMEVEMRLYEDEVNTTLIEADNRRKKTERRKGEDI